MGIGQLNFIGADYTLLDNENAVLSLRYRVIHGEKEDTLSV